MVLRERQKITSKYGQRRRRFHRGIDLRTWNLKFWKPQAIVFPEKCIVDRIWEDGWGIGMAVKPQVSTQYDELKFIHVKLNPLIRAGETYNKGFYMGKSMLSRLNKSHHLHFETWAGGKTIDPTLYLDLMEIEYD